jgi:hypothetical protein
MVSDLTIVRQELPIVSPSRELGAQSKVEDPAAQTGGDRVHSRLRRR